MNIKERIERIEALEAEFNEKIKKLKEEEQAFPKYYDDYWYIDTTGDVYSENWHGFGFEKAMLEMGNVFRTKEQAEFAVEKLKVEAELRKFSRPFKPMTDNFFIAYNAKVESLEIDCSLNTNIQGVIYFGSREEMLRAVESVDKERIKKYIFGLEELNGN